MILVTVGTHDKGFERLVRAADEMALEFQEQVVIQYGSSRYIPQHAINFRWASSQEMERLTCAARIVITHAAAGSMISILLKKKPMVVVPRSSEYGESIDGHQKQLAKAISGQGTAIQIDNPTPDALKLALIQSVGLKASFNSNQQLILSLKNQLRDWDQSDRSWIRRIFGQA
ncbi:MAG: glycosyltransferase [Anaerolineales bacterium]|jgi:beta-1,4-N-acetylglucosaminyltransferase